MLTLTPAAAADIQSPTGIKLNIITTKIIIIKNKTFLIFNYSNEVFIENLSNKIKLSELEDYLKTI